MPYIPTFAKIDQSVIATLSANKAPCCAYQVLLALSSFAQNKDYCWPSIAKLKAFIGTITEQSIHKGIRVLEKLGLIKRNQKRIDGNTNTKRFVLKRSQAKPKEEAPQTTQMETIADTAMETIADYKTTKEKTTNSKYKQTNEKPGTNENRFERPSTPTYSQQKKREYLENKRLQEQKKRASYFYGAADGELTKHERTKQHILNTKEADRNDLDHQIAVGELLNDAVSFRKWYFDKVELSLLLS